MARARQYDPAGQSEHSVAPVLPIYFPAAHEEQALALAALHVPATQAVAEVAPALHAEPAGQFEQSLAAVAPVVLRNLPAAHSVAADAPASQYAPVGQATHSDCPLDETYFPASHAAHEALPAGLPPMGASPDGMVRWADGRVEPLEVRR